MVTIRIVLGVFVFLAAFFGCIFDFSRAESGPLSYPVRVKYSAAFEWIVTVLLSIFVLTFTTEFRLIKKIGINLTTVRTDTDKAEEPVFDGGKE